MALNTIKIALLDRLKSLVGLPTIYYPNINADIPTDEHIVPYVLPANTFPVGIRTTNKEMGLFQVSIYVKKGSGEITALNYADTIIQGFPRNLDLGDVRIDQPASIGRSLYDGNWEITPVTIPYLKIT